MIQRIQSIYLSVIVLISLMFFKGNMLTFSAKTGEVIGITFNGIFSTKEGQNPELLEKLLPLSVIIILIIIIALVTIFLFKNRKVQLRFSWSLIIVASVFVIALIHVSFKTLSGFDASIIPGFKMILPLLILILSILAYRGIKKDDQLVKSYDRLR
jgi:hypothetical protein